MKLTKQQLRQIIKEELEDLLDEIENPVSEREQPPQAFPLKTQAAKKPWQQQEEKPFHKPVSKEAGVDKFKKVKRIVKKAKDFPLTAGYEGSTPYVAIKGKV